MGIGHTNDCDVAALNQCKAMSQFDEQTADRSVPKFLEAGFGPYFVQFLSKKTANKVLALIALPAVPICCFSYIGPKVWNSLQSGLKSSNNVNSFKHKIKDKFSNDLQNRENSPYIYY